MRPGDLVHHHLRRGRSGLDDVAEVVVGRDAVDVCRILPDHRVGARQIPLAGPEPPWATNERVVAIANPVIRPNSILSVVSVNAVVPHLNRVGLAAFEKV